MSNQEIDDWEANASVIHLEMREYQQIEFLRIRIVALTPFRVLKSNRPQSICIQNEMKRFTALLLFKFCYFVIQYVNRLVSEFCSAGWRHKIVQFIFFRE